jgi:RNA polymerase subunit RPABC4/transcription elongation factor Spt4
VIAIDDIDHPLLWIVPFAGFTLISLLTLVNIFLRFLPNGSGYLLMLSGCALLCASVAGFITELIKGRNKYVYVSMGASVIVGCIVFLAGYGFFRSNLVTGTGQAVVPAISEAISNLTITILPGVFTGALIGGGVGIIPEEIEVEPIEPFKEEIIFSPDMESGYEKVCRRCASSMPYDSMFCSQCGGTLKKRRTDSMKFCRFCGKKLMFLGEFCPECGKEISILDKPKVFIADQ